MPHALPLPGDVVWIRRQRWRVERATRDRDVVRLDVAWRRRRRTFLAPFDRVAAGRRSGWMRARSQEALARLACAMATAPDHRLPLALLDADVDLLPHQLEPALAIIAGHTRLLLADEVGLGKTIQTALVVAELVRRLPAPRILLIVPASLLDQWQAELLRRFGLECLRADRRHLDALSADGPYGANPWQRSGIWLVSADFVKQAHVLGSLPRDPWSLLVIDEAHTVCGDSDRYTACHALALRSQRVMLLTATPHSGDHARFARLAALGRHGDSGDLPVAFRRTRGTLGLTGARHVRWNHVALRDAETTVLDALVEFERAVLAASGSDVGEGARLLLSVFRKRALSTFAALASSLTRRLLWLGHAGEPAADWTQTRLAFDDDGHEMAALTAAIGLDPAQERRWLQRLKELAEVAAAADSRIRRLESLLTRSSEPVIVFSEFRESLEAVETRLRRSRSLAFIHGGLNPAEQRAELSRYLAGPASVLLATDVAGQGLNLQDRGRWVISLELPWNPARLEQRLGRVDRLGQRRTPHLTLLVARHDAERGLLSHLARRALNAQRSFSRDLLSDVAPSETQVGSALLGSAPGGTAKASEAPAFPLCRRWKRAGTVVARSLARRRRLKRFWRGPAEDCSRTIRARLRRPLAPETIVICSIPVLTGLDEFVERHLVAFLVPARLASLGTAAFRELARARLEPQLTRRIRKRSFVMRGAADRLAARHLGLADVARLDLRRIEAGQAGLFDSKALRDRASRLADAERLHSIHAHDLDTLRETPALRLGEIEVEFVLEGRQ